jgi:hypothetical protein
MDFEKATRKDIETILLRYVRSNPADETKSTFNSAIVNLSGKIGDRRVRVTVCAPALATWMNNHPSKEPYSPLGVVTGDLPAS